MKLSETERKLISYLQLQADQSLESASKALSIRANTLRASLKKLTEQNIIFPYAILSHHLLSLMQFDVYFSTPNSSELPMSSILEKCLQDENVPWVVKVGGDFQGGITILVKDAYQYEETLRRFSISLGHVFNNRSTVQCLSYSIFPRSYLAKVPGTPTEVTCETSSAAVSYDELDMRLLAHFSLRPLVTHTELSRATGMKPSTIQYRLQRLKKTGIIAAVVYAVNPLKIGIQSFRFFLQFRTLHPEVLNDLREFCRRDGRVSYLTRCIGAWDHELTLEVEDPTEVGRFEDCLRKEFGSFLSSAKIVPLFEEKISGPYPFRALGVE